MLSGCAALVLECNYDPDMLADGPYPQWLKARIGGPLGHLANAAAAEILAAIDRSRLQHVIAAHLSQTNNLPRLATAALVRRARVRSGGDRRRRSGERVRLALALTYSPSEVAETAGNELCQISS